MTPHLIRAAAVCALTALAACSGGGMSVPAPKAPAATQATGRATLTIKRFAPQTATASGKRRANEFSFGANSLVIDATQTGAAPYHTVLDVSGAVIGNGLNCNTDNSGLYVVCTAPLLLPVGSDTLTVSTNAARDGSGATLGSATFTTVIKDAQDNPLAVTLDGVATSMRLAVSDPNPKLGQTAMLTVTTQLYDATGTVLIAPQQYLRAVQISDQDATASTMLYTQATQNSTQRYNGTPVANASPSAPSKTVSVPDRYTQTYLTYDGVLASPFQIVAAYGTLNASVTVTPLSATGTRPGSTPYALHSWPSGAPRPYDPIFDTNGTLWVTLSSAAIAAIDPTTYQISATYPVPTAGRSLRAPAIGPDGAIYLVSGTVSGGVTTGPWYVTRFDPVTHAFRDYATSDQVLHLVSTSHGLWGAERNVGKLWQLPFTGTTAGTQPNEFAVSIPAVADTSPVLVPLPTRVFPSADGNLWVAETSYAAVDGTWLAKYSYLGAKLSETRLQPTSPMPLDAQAIDANGGIWFANLGNANEVVLYDTSSAAAQTFVVPRLYGQNPVSETTVYSALDQTGSFWFTSYLDSNLGRIDAATGRIDTFASAAGNTRGMTISNGVLVLAGWAGTTPFLVTKSTQ